MDGHFFPARQSDVLWVFCPSVVFGDEYFAILLIFCFSTKLRNSKAMCMDNLMYANLIEENFPLPRRLCVPVFNEQLRLSTSKPNIFLVLCLLRKMDEKGKKRMQTEQQGYEDVTNRRKCPSDKSQLLRTNDTGWRLHIVSLDI